MRVLSLFFGAVLCLTLLLPAGALAVLESPAQVSDLEEEPDSGQEEDSSSGSVWVQIFTARSSEVQEIAARLDALEESLPELSAGLREALTGIEEEYRRLVAIASVSRGLPTELTVVADWLLALQERLAAASEPLESSTQELKTRLEELSALEDDASGTEAGEDVARLRDFADRLADTRKRLAATERHLTTVLAPVRRLSEKITSQHQQITAAIPRLWRAYYQDRGANLYELQAWKSGGKQGLRMLGETLSLRMNAEVPQALSDWIAVVLRAAFFSIPLLLLLAGTRRLARNWPEVLRDGWLRLSAHSLPWLIAGLVMHIVALAPTGGSYRLFSVGGTLLMSIGQMELAWNLYRFNHDDLPWRSPLRPLFAPLLAGLVLLFLNLPAVFLGGIWLVVIAFCLWRAHRRGVDTPFPLIANLLHGHTLVLWVAAIMTVLGWGRLSILVCMAYAAMAVSLQQAVGFVRLTNLVSEHLPQEGLKALMSSLLLALVLPVVMVVATLATGLWTLAYPGGYYLLGHLIRLDFSVGETTFNMLQILFIFSAFYVTRSVISVGRAFIRELPKQGVRPDLVGPIQVTFTYVLWGLFALYTLNALGFSLTSLTVVAGGLSVGIGFGLQNIINNFISGLLVIFGQTMREGDVIEMGGGLLGTVKHISVRSTMVETFDNVTIFVPNAEFLTGRLTNWTHNGRVVRRSVSVGVAYGSDVSLVMRLLQQAAEENRLVLRYPRPVVLFLAFADSALQFELRYWIDVNSMVPVGTELHVAIERLFAENGVEIPFPQVDIHMRQGLPPESDGQPAPGEALSKEAATEGGKDAGSSAGKA